MIRYQYEATARGRSRVLIPAGNGKSPNAEALPAQLRLEIFETLAAMFWILSPQQAFAVGFWLVGYSDRPMAGVLVWLSLFRFIDVNTGEILISQAELAEVTGVSERDVPRILRELVSIGALTRRLVKVRGVRGPGAVRFYLNPACPEHIPPPDQTEAERAKSRTRRAASVPSHPKLEATEETRVFYGDLLAAADAAVSKAGLEATARSVQRGTKIARPIAMALIEGAKQRVRILERQKKLPEAPSDN